MLQPTSTLATTAAATATTSTITTTASTASVATTTGTIATTATNPPAKKPRGRPRKNLDAGRNSATSSHRNSKTVNAPSTVTSQELANILPRTENAINVESTLSSLEVAQSSSQSHSTPNHSSVSTSQPLYMMTIDSSSEDDEMLPSLRTATRNRINSSRESSPRPLRSETTALSTASSNRTTDRYQRSAYVPIPIAFPNITPPGPSARPLRSQETTATANDFIDLTREEEVQAIDLEEVYPEGAQFNDLQEVDEEGAPFDDLQEVGDIASQESSRPTEPNSDVILNIDENWSPDSRTLEERVAQERGRVVPIVRSTQNVNLGKIFCFDPNNENSISNMGNSISRVHMKGGGGVANR